MPKQTKLVKAYVGKYGSQTKAIHRLHKLVKRHREEIALLKK